MPPPPMATPIASMPVDVRREASPEPPAAARLLPVWEQAAKGVAPASHYFITPPKGLAPPLLFLLQPGDGHLYCYPLPRAGGGATRGGGDAGFGAFAAGEPIASVPALTAQPVTTSLAQLVVASILVLAPTNQLELYSCADDGTLRCLHRAPPPRRRRQCSLRPRPRRPPTRRPRGEAARGRAPPGGRRRRSS